ECDRSDGVEVRSAFERIEPAVFVRQLFLPARHQRDLAEAERAREEARCGEIHESQYRFDGAVHVQIIRETAGLEPAAPLTAGHQLCHFSFFSRSFIRVSSCFNFACSSSQFWNRST